jgi:general secretion pathway protein G
MKLDVHRDHARGATPAGGTAGFTLLELLVVLVIIGLLAGFVAPRFFAQLGKSEQKVARAQIEAFEKALDTYRLDTGRYPTTDEGLKALATKPGSADNRWTGPYLKKDVPDDPWGRPYQYRAPGESGKDYEIMSLGKDGVPGGSGDDADVKS